MKQPSFKFQSPTGMKDILPEEQVYFDAIEEVARKYASFYSFLRIDTPILEDYQLFAKGTGEATDIVEKQMYVLKTKGDEILALRPEFTPSLARSYFENGMIAWPHPVKLYTMGPVFRYEKPQAGRYRQFHQLNFETFGSKRPITDIEVIWLFYNILKDLKIKDLAVQINSIGDSQCRPYYKKVLVRYLKSQERNLCPTCKKRLKTNPLRVLDCKEEKCQKVISEAPQILDHLCDECKDHFKRVLEYLDDLEIPYILNPYLVRGLDYYTKTVFEIVSQSGPDGRQNALVGGGRYDDLLKLIGKKDIPACGGAMGVERVIALMKESGFKIQQATPQIFIAQLGDKAKTQTLKLMEDLRKMNILTESQLSKDSLTNQLKIANKLNVKFAVIIGEEEVLSKSVIIRDMSNGTQISASFDKAAEKIKQKIKGQKKS
ncbi:MAG: histidine--tRNA ligase [Candidatus Pacebacteria bacterium]|nr:histidine--tRNA ligase [Candidatus Paceibacterota bacterium]